MKKFILLSCAILFSIGLNAQLWYEAGIRAGANVSTQFNSGVYTDVETSWKPGFHLGIFGSLFYTEKLAAQLEFLYSEKGSFRSAPSFSGDEIVSYIDVPLTARFQVMRLLNLHAGPQFSFFTGAWRMPENEAAYSVAENYDDVDLGVVLGAELCLPIKLNLALRYSEGLLVTTDPRFYDERWKNRMVQVSLSYAIFGD